ncbi:hypothetical protein ACRN86_001521 [Enterobacter hormaechei]
MPLENRVMILEKEIVNLKGTPIEIKISSNLIVSQSETADGKRSELNIKGLLMVSSNRG